MAQLVKNLPAMQETWVQSLGWEDPLEKGRLPTPVSWPGEFHGLTVHGVTKSQDTAEQLSLANQQTHRSMEQDRKQRNKPMHSWLISTKEARIYNEKKTFFNKCCWGN